MRAEILHLAGRTALLVGLTAWLAWLLAWVAPTLPPFLVAALAIAPLAAWLLRRAGADRAARDEAQAGWARAEEQRRYRERWSAALLEHSSDLVADPRCRRHHSLRQPVARAHPRLTRRRSWSAATASSSSIQTITRRCSRPFAPASRTGGPPTGREFRIRHRNGSWRVVESAARAGARRPGPRRRRGQLARRHRAAPRRERQGGAARPGARHRRHARSRRAADAGAAAHRRGAAVRRGRDTRLRRRASSRIACCRRSACRPTWRRWRATWSSPAGP